VVLPIDDQSIISFVLDFKELNERQAMCRSVLYHLLPICLKVDSHNNLRRKNDKMKTKLISIATVTLFALMLAAPAMAKTTTTINYNQAQFQWRGITAFGAWTPGYSYQNDLESSDYTLTGNVLHTSWGYSPLVTDLHGESTVYVFDKATGLWIEHEGQVSYEYVAGYGDYRIVNFFRGYLDFGGNAPSTANFVHGVAYQWVYLYAPENAVLTAPNTAYAQWDAKVGAWLVGFSIYLWDSGAQSYITAFPSPFIEPVPASNYNPLGL
jgi:hypothetical protein